MQPVNLKEKLALFSTHWDPKIVGELNGPINAALSPDRRILATTGSRDMTILLWALEALLQPTAP